MRRMLLLGAGGLVVVIAAFTVAFIVSFRVKFRPVLDAVRRMNRRVMNPQQMRTAGQPGAGASVIQHVGRRSGTPYRTPVGAGRVDGGFVISLPYGSGTDWVRNVLAADEAVIEHEGEVVPVVRPRLIEADAVADTLTSGERRVQRLFGIHEILRLDLAEMA